MSADPENEYFSDGISEEILNALTKVEGLLVTARSSSFFFKGKNEDIREVGSKLGVANILSGSVRKAGKRIRITAQLTNTVDGYMIWSDALSLPLITNLADAYSFAGQFENALEQYDKAIGMDPQFRRAYEGKGMVYLANSDYENAIIDLEKYHGLIGHPLKGLSSLGQAYAVSGQNEKVQECLEKIKQRELLEPEKLFTMDYAFVHAGMGNFDDAFYYLNKTYEQRIGIACLGMIFCIRYPMLKSLRSDKRFEELMGKMKL